MISSPLFSVIVPVYNTEKYLVSCLDSIAAQSFKDFEVILVDDGSTDSSREICRRFASAQQNFRYIRKENGGSSSARNTGITKASGKWIAFIDSDDTVDSDYLEGFARIVSVDEDLALVLGGMTLHRNGLTTVLNHPVIDYSLSRKQFIRMVLARELPIFLFQSPCAKIYNRSFLISQHILFDESCPKSEDSLFNTELLAKEFGHVRISQMHAYHYNQNNYTSTTHRKSSMAIIQSLIGIGCRTAAIRHSLIYDLNFKDDEEVKAGIQKALGIICLSNTRMIEIEVNDKAKRLELYDYLNIIPYHHKEEKKRHAKVFSRDYLPLPHNPDYSWTDNMIIRINSSLLANNSHLLFSWGIMIIHLVFLTRKYRRTLFSFHKKG